MILRGVLMAKATYQAITDGEVRKLGDRQGLDTLVFLTVNDVN
jgi:hypothetical protein